MKSGMGAKHPAILGRTNGIESMLSQLKEAARHYLDGLTLRLQVARLASPGKATVTPANSAALENLRGIAEGLRKNGRADEAAAIEKEIQSLSGGGASPKTAAADLDVLRVEMAELKASVAAMRQQAGPDELTRERDRLLLNVIGKQDSTDPILMANKERLAAIEKLLTERADRALTERNAAAALLEKEKAEANMKDQIKMMEDLRKALDKEQADMKAADPAARIAKLQAEIDSLKKQAAVQDAASTSKDRRRDDLPYGIPVVGKKGSVYSPYAPEKGQVDVSGLNRHTKVECPYTGKSFRVP